MTIIQANILDWAAAYDGPKFHALLCDPPYHLTETTKRFGASDAAPAQYGTDGALDTLCALYVSISSTVAGIAKRYEVSQNVCFLVAIKPEQAERLDVMNILPRRATSLARIAVALQRLASLCLPVRPAIISKPQILRVVQSMAVRIAAWTRTIFTAAFALFQPTSANLEGLTAVKAIERLHFGCRRTRFDCGILAFWRTVLSTSMF
jgi:hypothetical protein